MEKVVSFYSKVILKLTKKIVEFCPDSEILMNRSLHKKIIILFWKSRDYNAHIQKE